MARPLRLEFPGALYHVTARGDGRELIFLDTGDRQDFLERLAQEVEQQRWRCPAYCLMGNHYHLLLETPEPNLARGMRRLNGAYTQSFNRRHARVGHVLQGRYKGIVVDQQPYLLELCRYVVLNPVRARLVERPEDWPWTSYRATAGYDAPPPWLDVGGVLAQFGEGTPEARGAYRRFVAGGLRAPSPWASLRGQIWLGEEAFRVRMERRVTEMALGNVPLLQQRPARPGPEEVVLEVARAFSVDTAHVQQRVDPDAFRAAIYLLRRVANLPLREVADWAGISPGRVSQIQQETEGGPQDPRLRALCARLGIAGRTATTPHDDGD